MHEIKEILEESCEIVEKELKDVNKKLSASSSKNPSDIDMLDKLTHSLKSIKTTMAMIDAAEEEEYSGYSGRRYTMPSMNYSGRRGGYSGEYSGAQGGGQSGASYGGEYSGARGRRGGYSRDGINEDIIGKLESKLRNARNEREAMAIRETIEILNNQMSEY